MSKKVPAAIIGASGYTGAELIRLLHQHPHVTLQNLFAESNAGQPVEAVYPHLAGFSLPPLIHVEQAKWSDIALVFCCLPHAMSQKIIAGLPSHLKIIDLSADFRLKHIPTYENWYGTHYAPNLQPKAVYGLSEIYREQIKTATLVANPGCYPTCASLPLVPLLKNQLIQSEDIIIDAKSGISGAGRSSKQGNLFCEVNENVKPYSICNHRHMPEIEQTLSEAASKEITVDFTPQVVPLSRGMLCSSYVKLTAGITIEHLHQALQAAYKEEPFVHLLPLGTSTSTRDVMGSNRCFISLHQGRSNGRAILVSTIDNLIKGASGQAVQNMNILLGFPETTGLDMVPVFP